MKCAVLIGLGAASIAMIYVLASSPSVAVITSHTAKEEAVDQPYIAIGKTKILVEIAKDESAIRKGLSGRIRLGAERGMLFIFPAADRYRFWMPDMHFPIDIIWIADGKTVGITEKISPEFNLARPRFYLPPVPVRYALEVNAGFAKMHGIAAGSRVTFHNIDK